MSNFLYFWRDRFAWWVRLLLGIATVGLCVLIGWLAPEWGNWGENGFWDSDVFYGCITIIIMITLNLCFGEETDGNGTEWAWKIASFLLTLNVFLSAQPSSVCCAGVKMASTLVVALTLIYAILGHTLMQNLGIGGFLYDILFYLCIIVAFVVTAIFPEASIGYDIDNVTFLNLYVVTIPYELALYVIAWLRFEPLHSLIEKIVKGDRYHYDSGSSSRSYSSSSSQSYTRDTNCKRCAYHSNTKPDGTYCPDYCTLHCEVRGYFQVQNGCDDFVED